MLLYATWEGLFEECVFFTFGKQHIVYEVMVQGKYIAICGVRSNSSSAQYRSDTNKLQEGREEDEQLMNRMSIKGKTKQTINNSII